jgi:hypothetical protein
VSTRAEPARKPDRDLERAWWRRTVRIIERPRDVFEAIRDEPEDAGSVRSEPMLAITWLAGSAAVLASSVGVNPMDGNVANNGVFYGLDGVTFAVWAFLAGGAYGFIAYWLLGGAVYVGARAAGSFASYRRARHVLVFAAAPVALSLLAIWPIRLAIYGSDLFHRGGADTGTPNAIFAGFEALFGAWALALLLLGVRIVYGWSWRRSAAAVVFAAVVLGLFTALPFTL